MYSTSFIKKILLVATVVLLYSCDKDFNAIGDGLINDDHFGLESEKYDVLAYNQEVTPVQSNGLPVNGLGIYDNAVFGTTTSNFVTQVSLSAYAPVIGDSPEIESVVLSIPYFSKLKTTNTDGSHVYELDSIFGATNGKLDLKVYESGVQMRSSYFNGGTQFPQFYYTDQNADFDGFKIVNPATSKPLNDDVNTFQNTQFFFDAKEWTDVTKDDAGKETTTRVTPEMRLNLNKDYFFKKILQAPASKLASQDSFQEYFRGLYFTVAPTADGSPTNMALLNFAATGSKITIKYKAKTAITTDPDATTEEKSITINLTGSAASLQQQVKKSEYATALANRNKTTGDERLYLNGGQGSLAVIELNGFGAKLDEIRKTNWLVNEANLVFTIDSDKMTGADEPRRIYLYDLDNNVPIIDYVDGSTGQAIQGDPKSTRYIYGGLINVDATTKRGKTYKIRLTNHIRNIIKDATVKNVRLGLVVTEDISIIASNALKAKNDVISQAPRASVTSPVGTILFGGNIPSGDANYAKRIQLQVYYTKPN
jgi:hypothetical protein